MTYLEIVNSVLRRLRENEVSTINENPYSKMIAEMVNDVKREVEDTWNWDVLRTTLTADTSNGLFNYVLVGSGTRFRVLDVINDTSNHIMQYRPTSWFDAVFLAQNAQNGPPIFYNFNGVDNNGDSQVDLFPIPDGEYAIRFNLVLPQADLVNDSDTIEINAQAVIFGTVARAIEERGDDGGLVAAQERYRSLVADLVAIEANRRPNEIIWVEG